ncbi:X-linked retinitis pigmentosa GTPase regulator [Frankliniella fusca]|uniref:X-linked retinitis pigmentosa GTPase regulator n=1 Tax=Frankliniella fusca TaxID=407009 RepID=A0AAE1HT72_9NEOP|nr:X-linked retinitis pigmentosa GTPase regulator [Frankliniella fusca]KAK3927733.1 X-linked retinitis pigmentosa GTPase regulator [Frankliniella fusca]
MDPSLRKTLHLRAVQKTKRRLHLDNLKVGLSRAYADPSSDDSTEEFSEMADASDGERGEPHANSEDPLNELDNSVNDAMDNDDMDVGDEPDEPVEFHDGDSNVDSDLSEDVSSEDGGGPPQLIDEAEKEQFVIDMIREWAQEPGVLSMSKLDKLLHRLSLVFPRMPLSYTTLFACDYEFNISQFDEDAEFWYKGIRANLDQLDLQEYLNKFNAITLDIGIDGLPLTSCKLWPILGDLVGSDNAPFIIAAYKGSRDPSDVDEFLRQYCNELRELLQNGYPSQGKVYEVRIRNYILDAPARSLIKCCTGHSGYCGCEKCTVWGEYHDNRVTFLDMDAPLRTDESFSLREQPKHHKGLSPLEDIGTAMISQFRLDPAHLAWGGAVKRLLDFWINVVGAWKLHSELVEIISSVFEHLRSYCPVDFNRKPRSLKYFKSFKFTEFRRIVLYDGILAFKDIVDDNVYKHFLLLHCGLYILSSKRLFQVKSALALQLLRTFVSHSIRIYGKKFVVYNIHSLIHLVEECDSTGLTLDEFSAFKFENKLKSVKETLRSGLHPLQQLARRDEEKKSSIVTLTSKPTHIVLSLKHKIVGEMIVGQQYRKLKIGSLTLKVGKSDSCFKTKNGDVVVLLNIVRRKKKIHLVCRKFNISGNFYEYPIPSSDLGILRVTALGREKLLFRLRDVDCKCFLMPDGNQFLCVPFIVVKFLPTAEDSEEYVDVSLESWIVGEMDDDMKVWMHWPGDKAATNFVRTQHPVDKKWKSFHVQVLRYYDTYLRARVGASKLVDDSTYDTEVEESQPKRRRIRNSKFIDSDSDTEIPVRKQVKASIAAPPPISQPSCQISSPDQCKIRRGRKGQEDTKKREREVLMERLRSARAAAKAKMNVSPSKKNWVVTSSPQTERTMVASPTKSPVEEHSPRSEKAEPPRMDSQVEYDESFHPDNFLATEMDNTFEMDDLDLNNNNKDTPSSPPTFRTFGDLPNTTSFYLSPKSAKSVSENYIRSTTATLARNEKRNLLFSMKTPTNDKSSACGQPPLSRDRSQRSVPAGSRDRNQSTSTVPAKAAQTVEERLEVMAGSLERLEVVGAEMSSKLDIALMNIGRLIRYAKPGERAFKVPEGMPSLPLGSKDELKIYETYLKQSDQHLASVCDYMESYVNTTVADPERKSVHTILPKMITNKLAENMNLNGGNGKISFRSLHLYKVLQGVMQTSFPTSDLRVTDDALQKWLKDAKWRKPKPSKKPAF